MSDDTRHVTGTATLVCAHCARTFSHASRPGPAPRYCRRSCRQRAYEARAAATTVAVVHHPDACVSTSGRMHALDPARPDPRADGTRTTMCGTKARPNHLAFASSPDSCARCARAAASRTITDHLPARDLAALLAAARETQRRARPLPPKARTATHPRHPQRRPAPDT